MKHSPRPREAANLSESVHQRLNMYALAATAAGVGMLGSPAAAHARIVYTPAHAQVNEPLPLDLNHDGKVDFFLFHYGFHTSTGGNALLACHAPFNNGTRLVCASSSYATNALNAIRVTDQKFGAALRRGDKIQHGDRFMNNQSVDMGEVMFLTSNHTQPRWFGPWVNGGKGVKNRYLGIKFKIGGHFHFGWARLTVTVQGTSFTATLTGYAYETVPSKAIIAGDKGPAGNTVGRASLGHLAAGASAIPAWRMKQTAATTH
jgi:hypothetical protein